MVLKHEAEDGICGRFRRRHSPCPSEASNLAPSLVSPPPPWVWPKVKATITDMRKKNHSLRYRCKLFILFPKKSSSLCRSERRGELQYLVIFGSLGQVKGGIDFGGALLTEGRQLEGNRLGQAITRFQLQRGRLSWDLVEVSEEICPKLQLKRGRLVPFPFAVCYNWGRDNMYG